MDALAPATGAYGGLVGTGGDGRYVYFVDHAKLTGEANARGVTAVAGEYNMYVYEPDGGGHVVRFIATLAQEDNEPLQDSTGDDTAPGTPLAVWARTAKARSSEVSPDGRFVAFGSRFALTGVANGGNNEVYVFDAVSGVLSCASCDPSGAPNGGAVLPFL